MIKYIVFFSFFLYSSFLYSATIKSIGSPRYFPPTPYSNTAMNAHRSGASVRVAVNKAGRFAVATINPTSVLALGKQLAKSNPYALAAMAATVYFQDDINQWFEPAEFDGEQPFHLPQSKDYNEHSCTIKTVDGNQFFNGKYEDCLSRINDSYEIMIEKQDSLTIHTNYSGQIFVDLPYVVYDFTYDYNKYSGGEIEFDRVATGQLSGSIISDPTVATEMQCPPESNPLYTFPVLAPDGETILKCLNPAETQKYKPQPVTLDAVVPQYADDLMEWHNTSIDALQNWNPTTTSPFDPQMTPYVDSTGNIEPEYIDSFNEPSLSDIANDYMLSVSSGNYQTSSPELPNYVPQEFLQPVEIAISSTFTQTPFADPIDSSITTPNITTDGAASQFPSPTGTASNPINVTGEITVNVEIPEDDTISQTEYEQSNQMFYNQFAEASSSTQSNTDTLLQTAEGGDADFINSLGTDVTNSSAFPDFPSIASLWGGFTTGTCAAFTSEASIGHDKRTITYDKHCPMYHSTVHPLLFWFLNITTAFYIILLAGRTFKSTNS